MKSRNKSIHKRCFTAFMSLAVLTALVPASALAVSGTEFEFEYEDAQTQIDTDADDPDVIEIPEDLR